MSNDDGVITLSIREFMDYGLSVYGGDGKKIGTVFAYEIDLGYMRVKPHALSEKLLYIPFSTITHIDPREVFVSRTREEVHRLYRDPPHRSTTLRERTDPVTGEDDSVAITREPSGYDSSPVVVDDVQVGKMAHHIAPGFSVVSSEIEDVGTVREVDRTVGQMVVRKGRPSENLLVIPLAVVDFVDREDRLVYLAISDADVHRLPAIKIEKPESDEAVVGVEVRESDEAVAGAEVSEP